MLRSVWNKRGIFPLINFLKYIIDSLLPSMVCCFSCAIKYSLLFIYLANMQKKILAD